MKNTTSWFIRSGVALATLLSCSVGYAGSNDNGNESEVRGGGGGGATPTTFSGRATVLDATILGLGPIIVSDTGPLSPMGGNLETSLLDVDVPGVITANVAHATTIGQGNRSRGEASVADTVITVAGHTITAGFLMSRAEAVCGSRASTNGSSEVVNLVIDGGTPIVVSGAPNETVDLPGGAGSIIINEQIRTSSGRDNGSITVNALHIVLLNPLTGETLANIIVASSHADINCGAGPCSAGDFITGGGWIMSPGRNTFGVAGGIKNRGLWGHLTYIDHVNGVRVKGTSVTSYLVTGPTSRQIKGTAEINGTPGTYQVDLSDNGEPGRQDMFMIMLNGAAAGSGTLTGGNIQLHNTCK
jgi:hypothetical protein